MRPFLTRLWLGREPEPTLVRGDVLAAKLSFASLRHELRRLTEEIAKMQEDINRLADQVRRNSDVTAGAAVLIRGLAQQIRDAADDPAEVRALADQLLASNDTLAAAVAEGTTQPPA